MLEVQPLTTEFHFCPKQLTKRKVERLREEMLFAEKNEKFFRRLTPRQKEILKLIVKGYTNKLIGEQLHISENTVRTHRNKIWELLEINHIAEAIYFAYAFDLV